MKKISILLIVLFSTFAISLPDTTFATGNLDAQCSAAASEMAPLNGGNAVQTFVTNYDRFGGISFYLGSAGQDDPTGTFEFALRREDGSAIASGDITVTGNTPNNWYTIDMPGFEVTRGGTYQVYAHSDDMGYTIGRSATNCYVPGVGYANDSYELSGGGDWLFKTYGFNSDSTPPVLSNISVSSITKTSATINWQSSESSVVEVAYGTTTSYGNTKESSGPGALSANLAGLTQGTTYHFKIRGVDQVSNWSGWSADQTFTTATDAVPGASNTQTSTSIATTTNSTTTSGTKSQTVKEVDTSIASPTLAYVMQGSDRTDAPISEISVTVGDTFKLGGQSFANATIGVFVGDDAFSTTADKDGKWEVTIDTTNMKPGDYKIVAQAQDLSKNKGSQDVELLSLKISEKDNSASTVTGQSGTKSQLSTWQKLTDQYKWYSLGALIVLLGLVIFVFYLMKTGKLRNIFKKNTNKETI